MYVVMVPNQEDAGSIEWHRVSLSRGSHCSYKGNRFSGGYDTTLFVRTSLFDFTLL